MNERSNVDEEGFREGFGLVNAEGVSSQTDTGYFPIP